SLRRGRYPVQNQHCRSWRRYHKNNISRRTGGCCSYCYWPVWLLDGGSLRKVKTTWKILLLPKYRIILRRSPLPSRSEERRVGKKDRCVRSGGCIVTNER